MTIQLIQLNSTFKLILDFLCHSFIIFAFCIHSLWVAFSFFSWNLLTATMTCSFSDIFWENLYTQTEIKIIGILLLRNIHFTTKLYTYYYISLFFRLQSHTQQLVQARKSQTGTLLLREEQQTVLGWCGVGCFSHSFMLLLDLEKKNFKNASQVIIAIAQNKTNYGVQGQERQKRSEKRF